MDINSWWIICIFIITGIIMILISAFFISRCCKSKSKQLNQAVNSKSKLNLVESQQSHVCVIEDLQKNTKAGFQEDSNNTTVETKDDKETTNETKLNMATVFNNSFWRN